MDALQPSFMLPPNFLFPPEGKIKPGIVLGQGKSNIPNPDRQLHDDSSKWTDLEPTPLPSYHYSGNARSNTKVGFWISALSLVEIGLGVERGGDDNLVINTGPAKIIKCSPDEAYIPNLMRGPFLSEYTERPKCRPVYLITGVMIAESATIEVQRGGTSVYRAKIAINSDGFGVPVKVGPEFERGANRGSETTWDLIKPFVLAYELKKIRRKVFSGFKEESHVTHALWDDSQTSADDDDWEVEAFTQSSESSSAQVGDVQAE